MLKTLSEIKNSSVGNIAGVDVNSAQFTRYVNEACERLLSRGDWAGTVVPMHVCVRRGCLVFPRYVGSVRKMAVCRTPIDIRNNWFSFFNHSDWNGFAGNECGLQGPTPSPVFQDILGDGRAIRVYNDCTSDIGKTITIFGLDNSNQPLRTQDSNGNWSDGMRLTLSVPWTDSTTTIRKITRVVKDVTQGNVRIYAGHPDLVPKRYISGGSVYDATHYFYIDGLSVGSNYTIVDDGSRIDLFYNTLVASSGGRPAVAPGALTIDPVVLSPTTFTAINTRLLWRGSGTPYAPVGVRLYDSFPLEDIAVYEATQVNPEFQRYQLKIPGCSDCATVRSVVALVKLKFVPAVSDNDLVMIGNTTALKLMLQAIQAEEAGSDAAATVKEAKAIRELNLELANAQPDDQIPVDLGETGGTWIGQQRCY